MEENKINENKPAVYDGGVSEEQVNKWKAVHRKVVRIDVAEGDELHTAWFKRPTIETISAVQKVSKTDDVKGATVLYDNCFLGGDPEIREDALLFMSATTQLGKMFNSCLGSLKNL